jgi:hypothetical protein
MQKIGKFLVIGAENDVVHFSFQGPLSLILLGFVEKSNCYAMESYINFCFWVICHSVRCTSSVSSAFES